MQLGRSRDLQGWKRLFFVSSPSRASALMAAVDSTVVLLALFPTAEDFHSDFVTMIWVIIPFALATAALGPPPDWGILADRFGFKRVAITGILATTLALVLFSQLTTSTTLIQIGVIEAVSGVGLGFFWPSNTSAIMSATPPAKYGVGSGTMNTFRNTGMILSFALSLTAATSVIPAGVVYQLFIGSLTGKLPPALAISYLAGQSFAFEIPTVLLLIGLVFVVLTPKGTRPRVVSRVAQATAATDADS